MPEGRHPARHVLQGLPPSLSSPTGTPRRTRNTFRIGSSWRRSDLEPVLLELQMSRVHIIYYRRAAPRNIWAVIRLRRRNVYAARIKALSLPVRSSYHSLSIQPAPSTNTMSQASPAAASSTSTDFEAIFRAALDAYKSQTKKDIASHPLAAQLQSCDSSSAILAVLRAQVQAVDQSQSADEKWTKWLDPTVNVLYAFSTTLGNGVGVSHDTLSHSRSTL